MQPYYYDNRSSHGPHAQQPSYSAGGWTDGLAAQQYGADPRTYSTAGATTPYAGSPYGRTMSAAYPTSTAQGSPYTDPTALYPSGAYPQHQQPSWQPATSSTYDPYSVQHTSLNANPGSAPVFLYPPSHAGSVTPTSGSSAAYPSRSTAHSYPYPYQYPEDRDDDAHGRNPAGSSLAWDRSQHFTMQGTPRERVAIACDRCRVRKMKCDGAHPACGHCQHRGVECRYEPEPGRRGPDQGQRVRSPPGQRKPRTSKSATRHREYTPPEDSGYRW